MRDYPDFNIRPARHAYQRMAERAVASTHIRPVLRSGSLVRVEQHINTGLDKYRVAGRDADGRALEIVVNFTETGNGLVVVITVIDPG